MRNFALNKVQNITTIGKLYLLYHHREILAGLLYGRSQSPDECCKHRLTVGDTRILMHLTTPSISSPTQSTSLSGGYVQIRCGSCPHGNDGQDAV
jgi:hypothetical protein